MLLRVTSYEFFPSSLFVPSYYRSIVLSFYRLSALRLLTTYFILLTSSPPLKPVRYFIQACFC
ncbi:MAG: hypothetical protein KAT38_00360, partial [Bacteroidales bacterium]|nr:hypothetical protein [Bacteroidales bacterium]